MKHAPSAPADALLAARPPASPFRFWASLLIVAGGLALFAWTPDPDLLMPPLLGGALLAEEMQRRAARPLGQAAWRWTQHVAVGLTVLYLLDALTQR